MTLDFHLLLDPGSSTLKYLLWRNGQVISHFVASSCDRIAETDYLEESTISYDQWGSGVVEVPFADGDRYYRVGVNPVQATTDVIEKWESATIKLVCALGWLGRSSSSELRGSLRVLLPLDEITYDESLMLQLSYALKNGAQVNGASIDNVKIKSAAVLPEGTGFCAGHQFKASLMAGHCDLSFIL
ncbi:MAG: hypothetical protein ACRCZS_27500, partial [Chroococcidiopsis sp.]